MGEIGREKEIADPHARAEEQGGCHGPASSRRNSTRRFVDAFAGGSRRERRVALRRPLPTRGADAPPLLLSRMRRAPAAPLTLIRPSQSFITLDRDGAYDPLVLLVLAAALSNTHAGLLHWSVMTA